MAILMQRLVTPSFAPLRLLDASKDTIWPWVSTGSYPLRQARDTPPAGTQRSVDPASYQRLHCVQHDGRHMQLHLRQLLVGGIMLELTIGSIAVHSWPSHRANKPSPHFCPRVGIRSVS
jgi:hypothetical protein